MIKEIIIEDIPVIIQQKNIKHMYLKIKSPNGEVHISAPHFINQKEIEQFVKSKRDWIKKQQTKISSQNIEVPFNYIDGEKHMLWGEKYTLQLTKYNKTKIDKTTSTIYLPKKTSVKKRKYELDEFYREELKKELPELLNECIKIVKRKPSEIKIRKMKNWGNCRRDGTITLNLYLAKKDKECVKYVIIHELCHLIEFNHSKNFKKLMDKFIPNWMEIKKRLNED